jgi:hypothetical protein
MTSIPKTDTKHYATAFDPTAIRVPNIYHRGDEARYTGRTIDLYGGHFYEVELLEGHRKGTTVVVSMAPKIAEVEVDG